MGDFNHGHIQCKSDPGFTRLGIGCYVSSTTVSLAAMAESKGNNIAETRERPIRGKEFHTHLPAVPYLQAV